MRPRQIIQITRYKTNHRRIATYLQLRSLKILSALSVITTTSNNCLLDKLDIHLSSYASICRQTKRVYTRNCIYNCDPIISDV